MARRRFSRIIEAARLYQAVDNYKTWLTNFDQRSQGIGDGNPRPASQPLYITPFAIELPTGCKVKQSASETAYNNYSSYLGNKISITAPTDGANILKPAGYKAPRIIVRIAGTSKTTPTSAITGMKYLSYGGSSLSVPFGKGADTDQLQTVFNSLKTAIENGVPNSKVGLKDEEYQAI